MSISDRYRELVVDVQTVLAEMTGASGEEELENFLTSLSKKASS